MTNVVAIELCADHFKTEQSCLDYLKDSPYAEILRVSKFRLKKNGQAQILTKERKRAVWKWSQGLGTHERLDFTRPMSTVCLALAAGLRFSPTDYPSLLPKTIEAERIKKEKLEARKALLQAQKEERHRMNPPKAKKRRSSSNNTGAKRKKTGTKTANEQEFGIVLPADTTPDIPVSYT